MEFGIRRADIRPFLISNQSEQTALWKLCHKTPFKTNCQFLCYKPDMKQLIYNTTGGLKAPSWGALHRRINVSTENKNELKQKAGENYSDGLSVPFSENSGTGDTFPEESD